MNVFSIKDQFESLSNGRPIVRLPYGRPVSGDKGSAEDLLHRKSAVSLFNRRPLRGLFFPHRRPVEDLLHKRYVRVIGHRSSEGGLSVKYHLKALSIKDDNGIQVPFCLFPPGKCLMEDFPIEHVKKVFRKNFLKVFKFDITEVIFPQ